MTITAYNPPRTEHRIDLKLDANEGRPPPKSFLDSLTLSGSLVSRYPSTLALERAIAERLNVDPKRVVVTAGGDDALDRFCRAFLASGGTGRTAAMTTPTFEMIPRYAIAAGAKLLQIAWHDGAFPISSFADAVTRADASFIVTPNNPTGAVASIDDVRAASRAAGERPLCVDLAYTEFADVDLTADTLSLPNTVIIRTFSKACGLAGIRAGYAVAPERFAPLIRHAGSPYAVAATSIAIASAWLERGEPYMRESVAIARSERASLVTLLRSLGVAAIDSQANFVLIRSTNAWTLADRLAERGVGVRRFPPTSSLCNHLRIGCPCDAASLQRLTDVLREVLSSETST